MDAAKAQTVEVERSFKSNSSYHIQLGFATLFDLQGSLTIESPHALSQCSDAEAIYSDWLAIFGDLQGAFQTMTDGTPKKETV